MTVPPPASTPGQVSAPTSSHRPPDPAAPPGPCIFLQCCRTVTEAQTERRPSRKNLRCRLLFDCICHTTQTDAASIGPGGRGGRSLTRGGPSIFPRGRARAGKEDTRPSRRHAVPSQPIGGPPPWRGAGGALMWRGRAPGEPRARADGGGLSRRRGPPAPSAAAIRERGGSGPGVAFYRA